MNSLNKVTLIGRTTAIPEIRTTPAGKNVANFSLATSRSWKDQNGEKQEITEFHNIVAWSGLATILEKFVKKGKQLYVEGYLQTRSWDDENGTKKYKTEIVAENIILLSDSKNGSSGSEHGEEQEEYAEDSEPAPAQKPAKKQPKLEEEISLEEIPF